MPALEPVVLQNQKSLSAARATVSVCPFSSHVVAALPVLMSPKFALPHTFASAVSSRPEAVAATLTLELLRHAPCPSGPSPAILNNVALL